MPNLSDFLILGPPADVSAAAAAPGSAIDAASPATVAAAVADLRNVRRPFRPAGSWQFFLGGDRLGFVVWLSDHYAAWVWAPQLGCLPSQENCKVGCRRRLVIADARPRASKSRLTPVASTIATRAKC